MSTRAIINLFFIGNDELVLKCKKNYAQMQNFSLGGGSQSAKKWATKNPHPLCRELNPGLAKNFICRENLRECPYAKGVSSQPSYNYVVFLFFPSHSSKLERCVKTKNHPLGGNLFVRCSSELNPGLEPGDAAASRWDHI